jgi:hypothetical protein
VVDGASPTVSARVRWGSVTRPRPRVLNGQSSPAPTRRWSQGRGDLAVARPSVMGWPSGGRRCGGPSPVNRPRLAGDRAALVVASLASAGLEIAGLVGVGLAARGGRPGSASCCHGFIRDHRGAGAARLAPADAAATMIAAHRSAEPGHERLLRGSSASARIPRAAACGWREALARDTASGYPRCALCRCYREMAHSREAGVSEAGLRVIGAAAIEPRVARAAGYGRASSCRRSR